MYFRYVVNSVAHYGTLSHLLLQDIFSMIAVSGRKAGHVSPSLHHAFMPTSTTLKIFFPGLRAVEEGQLPIQFRLRSISHAIVIVTILLSASVPQVEDAYVKRRGTSQLSHLERVISGLRRSWTTLACYFLPSSRVWATCLIPFLQCLRRLTTYLCKSSLRSNSVPKTIFFFSQVLSTVLSTESPATNAVLGSEVCSSLLALSSLSQISQTVLHLCLENALPTLVEILRSQERFDRLSTTLQVGAV